MTTLPAPAPIPTLIWQPDALPGCEFAELPLPDAEDGPCVATLVRRLPATSATRVVLYIHGFNDYFFQNHMAAAFNAEGFAFYALDLRRYGRSLRPAQYPNFCRDLHEYYAEIDLAISYIRAEHPLPLLLNAHSTGGLIASLYAHDGELRDQIGALFLNSPYVEINANRSEQMIARFYEQVGLRRPFTTIPITLSPLYGQSIHHACKGEWIFDVRWKPLEGFLPYAGWARAIRLGQRTLQAGLQIACPILLMHSARSHRGTVWSEAFLSADTVLDVAHMRQYGPGLGPDTTLIEIDGGLHDLVLSALPVRQQVFRELFAWLNERLPA